MCRALCGPRPRRCRHLARSAPWSHPSDRQRCYERIAFFGFSVPSASMTRAMNVPNLVKRPRRRWLRQQIQIRPHTRVGDAPTPPRRSGNSKEMPLVVVPFLHGFHMASGNRRFRFRVSKDAIAIHIGSSQHFFRHFFEYHPMKIWPWPHPSVKSCFAQGWSLGFSEFEQIEINVAPVGFVVRFSRHGTLRKNVIHPSLKSYILLQNHHLIFQPIPISYRQTKRLSTSTNPQRKSAMDLHRCGSYGSGWMRDRV